MAKQAEMSKETKVAGLAGAAASSFGALYSAFLQADLIREQAGYQRDIAEFNARMSEYNAWQTEAFGATLIARQQVEIDKTQGAARVAAAANGADIKTGSMREIYTENQLNGFLNKVDMQNRINEQVRNQKAQAGNIRTNAAIAQTQAELQAYSASMGAWSRVAGNAVDAFLKYGLDKPTSEDLKQRSTNDSSGYGIELYDRSKVIQPAPTAETGFFFDMDARRLDPGYKVEAAPSFDTGLGYSIDARRVDTGYSPTAKEWVFETPKGFYNKPFTYKLME